MNRRLKVATIVGTRPEIIRLSLTIRALDRHCDHLLFHTGQSYDFELNEIFFQDMEIRKPDIFLGSAGSSGAETIGNVIIRSHDALFRERPDAVLILGDTNSSLAVIAAKRLKIPSFHMEAGNRCFDMRVPEEINRRIVDHTADINLTYSDIAREHLLAEGLPSDRIIKTGSPMFEVLSHFSEKISLSDVLVRLALEPGAYFLVSAHREENIDSDKNFAELIKALNVVAKTYGLPVVVSTHPRTRQRIDSSSVKLDGNIRLVKPLGFSDYVKLQQCARAVLSDSGTISEEASILNLRALNLREAHERPEGMEEGSVMLVGTNSDRILQGLSILESQSIGADRTLRQVADYAMPNVSEKVVRIIHSYTDYVRRVVWKEY